MEKQNFIIHATNDKIWNYQELVEFLVNNQHKAIKLTINPEAICLETLGIYKLLECFSFSDVTICTENPLEKHHRYKIEFPSNRKPYRWFSHQPNIPDQLHQWSGDKKFLAFYHRPTASRLGFASYLNSHYADQSLIHFSYQTDIDRLSNYEFNKLALLRIESLSEVADLLPQMPIYAYENSSVDEVMCWYDYSRDPGITLYKDIFVDIVAETHVLGNTFYPTEKTARPIWLKKPFLIHASRDYFDYLHQMGFLTFNDFWSEYYNGYEGRDRYLMMLEVIDTLAKKPTVELLAMYKDMQYILNHNYNLLRTHTYNTTITPI